MTELIRLAELDRSETVDDVVSRLAESSLQNLYAFLDNPESGYTTRKGDPRINLIDQRRSRIYVLPSEKRGEFMDLYWKASQTKAAVLGFSERQGSEETPNTGLAFDFDLILKDDNTDGVHRNISQVVSRIIRVVATHLEDEELEVHAFVIARPCTTKKDEGYKYGFHVLVPSILAPRSYKKYLMKELEVNESLMKTIRTMGVVNAADCLDKQYASNPVLLLGSSKKNGFTYEIAYQAFVKSHEGGDGTEMSVLSDDHTKPYNMAWELSLNLEAQYPDKEPLVRKKVYSLKPSIAAQAKEYAERSQGGLIRDEDIDSVDNSVDFIIATDVNARQVKMYLDAMDPPVYEERAHWRNIVFAVANTSDRYFNLVKAFSQRCPQKFDENELKKLWEEAVSKRFSTSVKNPITIASLRYMARTRNPEKYRQIMNKDVYSILTKLVYEQDGKVGHYQFADILHIMFSERFVSCPYVESSSGIKYRWYEFITPNDEHDSGEVWKWRMCKDPVNLKNYISTGLFKITVSIVDDIKTRLNNAQETEKVKFYSKILNSFKTTRLSLQHHAFKENIIDECVNLFIKRRFIQSLDKDGKLFGVGNGILNLELKNGRVQFINHYHEHCISRYTPVRYKPFDPEDFGTRKVLNYFKTIIPERDARLFIIMSMASCLSGWAKSPLLTIFSAGGSNGKTTLMVLLCKVMGDYGKTIPANVLTGDPPSAEKPNSAVASLNGKRVVYCEETGRNHVLNSNTVKSLNSQGEISVRDLHSKQTTFITSWRMWIATNFLPLLDSKDYAVLRRIVLYMFKVKFVENPVAPHERLNDPDLASQWPEDDDILEGFLSILVYFYELLHTRYGGNIRNVKSPTMEAETQAYFNKSDYVNKFITHMIVDSPDAEETAILTLVNAYKVWLSSFENIDKRTIQDSENITKEFLDHPLIQKKYLSLKPDGTATLVKCRVLTKERMTLGDNETSLNIVQKVSEGYGAVQQDEPLAWWDIDEEKVPAVASIPSSSRAPTEESLLMNDDYEMVRIERNEESKQAHQSMDQELGL